MSTAAIGDQGIAGEAALNVEAKMSVATNMSVKESFSAAPSSAALLISTPSSSPTSLRDSGSCPGSEGAIGDVMISPLQNPGLGPHTPSPTG